MVWIFWHWSCLHFPYPTFQQVAFDLGKAQTWNVFWMIQTLIQKRLNFDFLSANVLLSFVEICKRGFFSWNQFILWFICDRYLPVISWRTFFTWKFWNWCTHSDGWSSIALITEIRNIIDTWRFCYFQHKLKNRYSNGV